MADSSERVKEYLDAIVALVHSFDDQCDLSRIVKSTELTWESPGHCRIRVELYDAETANHIRRAMDSDSSG